MRTIINLKSKNNHYTTLYHVPAARYGDYLASYNALILSSEGKETDVGMFREGVAESLFQNRLKQIYPQARCIKA
jgi:hypothetical protein